MLPFPVLNSFNNTMQMRLSALKSHFSQLKETANTQQEESVLMSGEEMQPITKCFSSLEVSTNRGDANRLTNTDFSSYWQSNGSARSHWIRLRIKSNVVIRQLCVGVAASDQSYMPQFITISVGKNCRSQREVKEIRIPSHCTGDIVLFENAKMYYPVVQINVKRCHRDGCDTRIHNVKTIGYRIVKESGVSVMDASASWYLQVLAATTSACIPTAPQLREVITAHTLEALKHMAPLSLSPASGENPLFLTPHVLHQMDTFLRTISVDANGRHEADGLRMLLALNLAHGHTAGLLQTLHWLQESPCMELEAAPLLKNLDTVRDSWLKKQVGNRKKDYSRSMGLGLGAVHPKLSGSTIDTETRERVKWGLSSYATESQSIVCRTVEGYHVRASDFHEDYVLQQLLQPRGSTSRMNLTASLEILACQLNIVYQAVKSTHYTCMDLRNSEYVYT